MKFLLLLKLRRFFRNFCGVYTHKTLTDLLIWFSENFDEPHVTSSYRQDDPGVHGSTPLRGIDVRSYIYNKPQVIVENINKAWIYDPNRPEKLCAIFHNVGYGAHIHLQVHDNTRKIL